MRDKGLWITVVVAALAYVLCRVPELANHTGTVAATAALVWAGAVILYYATEKAS